MADAAGCGEAEAERRLFGHIRRWTDPTHRPKPETRPGFPGSLVRQVAEKPRFPLAMHNLPPANPDFVGREQVLTELRDLLAKGRGPAVLTQAVTGLGGIGKTQTALAYCYRHLAAYRLVWWLRAGSPEVLAADYGTLAGPLGLDPAAEQEELHWAIHDALRVREEGWLLVLDDVEDPALPGRYLPTTGKGHALITSRRSDWYGIAKAFSLQSMFDPEALQLLTGRPNPEALPAAEMTEAKILARDLGHLPLTVAQARAYTVGHGSPPRPRSGRRVAGALDRA